MCTAPRVTYVSSPNDLSTQSVPVVFENIAKIKMRHVLSVTASDTRVCENHVHEVEVSSARARSRGTFALGWCAARCRAKAWPPSSRPPPPEGAACRAPSVSRHVQGPSRRALPANANPRGRAGAELARGAGARPVPARSLLDPGRSRAHGRRGYERAGSRVRAQVARRPFRTRGESGLPANRAGARGSLPRVRAADSARGPERDCIRPAERAPTPGEGRARAPAVRVDRSCLVGAVVRRLADRIASSPRFSRRRGAAHLAPQRRLAPSGADRSSRGSRCAGTTPPLTGPVSRREAFEGPGNPLRGDSVAWRCAGRRRGRGG